MATMVPKLSSGGTVDIRFVSMELGTTKWREGTFEILEKDNKVNLCVKFNSGGALKTFQLNQNVKTVTNNVSRISLTLKDNNIITLDKMSPSVVQRTKEYLEKLKQGKSVLKSSHGSANFSVLSHRSVKNENSPSGERQTTPRRQSAEGREETMPRKLLSCPGRAASTPTRTGLSENRAEKRKRLLNSESDLTEDYPKENDSSSNNKATSDPSRKFLLSCKEKLKQADENRSSAPLGSSPLQPSSFYVSRSGTKDYSQSRSFLDSPRPASTAQTSSAKRSLVLPSHSTPFKKVRSSLDYGGWNKQRPSALTQPQSPLQGFSNLGNTCYMNAILQSLFSLPSFSSDMLKQSIPWKKVPINALLRRFAHLMLKKDVSCPETKKDLLRKVKNAISSTAERFSGNMQNDAHEFLSQCLDQLKDDVEKMNKSLTSNAAASSSVVRDNSSEAMLSAFKVEPGEEADTSRLYTCPVAVNMEFEVQHTITCKCCGEVVTKREQFNDLSIDLPRRKKTLPLRSIQDSLDLFFRMEEIEYSCEKCYGKSATVAHKFSKLPRVLILHLKRYSFNAQLSLNSKLGQQVVIPRYLTLLSHCTEFTRPPISLGWTTQASSSRTLKISPINSPTASFRRTGGKVANSSCSSILLDSDCEEEPIRRVSVNRKRRFSSCLPEEDERSEEKAAVMDPAEFDGINDDEMLAAVLELSPDDAGLSAPPTLEDEPTSSPDTGFGDSDVHDLAYHTDLLETGKKPADVLDSLDLTMDENKENQTPECLQQQGELDWVQQYNLDQEREEQELQQALAQSLQEHEAQELREDDDLKRATELSLQEFSNSLPEVLCSDEDSGNEDILDMEYSEAEAESLKRNAETGDLANSYRLISVVSHIGSNSSSGHYISDVYDMKKQSWLTYNDLDVSRTQEAAVQRDRDRSGYIFFYMHKDVFEQLSEMERSGSSSGSEAGKNILQPL
uniref:Ubiquitin carboxyl-terminal hydrolase n=2 Tax=Nothobranchius kuhntae TaxID=321403 RepID=A0A1A8KJI2_NOTKU